MNTVLDLVGAAGAGGPVLFFAAQFLIGLTGAVPAAPFALAAGALYGPGAGFAVAALANFAVSAIAFGLGRSLLRPFVQRLLARRQRLLGIDGALSRDGWKLVALMRLSPVMPFAATSYLLGLSSVGWRHYLAGTVAMTPTLFGYVLLGALGKAGIAAWRGGDPVGMAMLATGACATLLLAAHVGTRLRRHVAVPAEARG